MFGLFFFSIPKGPAGLLVSVNGEPVHAIGILFFFFFLYFIRYSRCSSPAGSRRTETKKANTYSGEVPACRQTQNCEKAALSHLQCIYFNKYRSVFW